MLQTDMLQCDCRLVLRGENEERQSMGYPKARTDGRGHFWIGSFETQRRLRKFETFARIANKPNAVRCVDRLW